MRWLRNVSPRLARDCGYVGTIPVTEGTETALPDVAGPRRVTASARPRILKGQMLATAFTTGCLTTAAHGSRCSSVMGGVTIGEHLTAGSSEFLARHGGSGSTDSLGCESSWLKVESRIRRAFCAGGGQSLFDSRLVALGAVSDCGGSFPPLAASAHRPDQPVIGEQLTVARRGVLGSARSVWQMHPGGGRRARQSPP